MNLQFYIEKLQNSDAFKEFIKENKDAYFCSGFFTIDKEGVDNQTHLDFYVPEKKEMFSFKLQKGVEKVPVEMITENVPEMIGEKLDFDFNEVEKMIIEEMDKQKVKNKLQKIMISLQGLDEKSFLVCTIFVSMFGLLKIHIDLEKNEVVLFEKKSLFDIVKRS